jgi:CHAT domain-containing protein/tetratricopeptide (TPR) repeat protein
LATSQQNNIEELIKQGVQEYRSKQYQKALQIYQIALRIAQKQKNKIFERELSQKIGVTHSKLGNYTEALQYLQQSLSLTQQEGNRSGEASILNDIGGVYQLQGNFLKALETFQKTLSIRKQVGDRLGEARTLSNIGATYDALAKYPPAITSHQRALAIFEQQNHRQGIATVLNNLALVQGNLGKYNLAIELYQKSLSIRKEIGDRIGEGQNLNNIGYTYSRLQQNAKAITYYEQALVLRRQINDGLGEALTLNNLGYLYAQTQAEKALPLLQQALIIFQQLGNLSGEGNTLDSLAVAYQTLDNYPNALQYYLKALNIFHEIGDRSNQGNTLSNIGKLLAKQKQIEIAILFYKQSVNLRESIRKDIRGLSKEEQKSYLSTIEETYRNLADLLLKQDRILEAQQVLDLLKVQELGDYLRTVRGNSQTQQGIDLQRPEQNIIALASELNTLQQKDRDNKLSATEQQRLAQLVQIEQDQNKQFNSFLNSPEIKKLITELRRVEDQQNLNLASYRKLQKDVLTQIPKAVLLYPLILDDRIELIIMNAKTPPLRRTVKIKREQLNQEIVDFLSGLRDAGSEDVKEPAQKLYKILIQPFEAELKELKIDTIIYAPDGQLRYIPLSALHDGKQWLVEKYRVNNITAESLTSFTPKPLAKPRILAGAFGGKAGDKTRAGFDGLPATLIEVQEIASLFPNTTTFTEAEFSKQITETKANSHTILHLATHGQLSVGTPEDSFILFGNGEKATIREIQDWSLSNVDLVILSACQSGIGSKLGTGVEILGLGYQMQAAGARVAIASLWLVNDVGTQALMTAFYSELQKGDVTVTEALRRAQVTLIKSPKYNHPNYWSAFFAIGNGL